MSEQRRLTTWKEIATYLSRGVRTVQRWEISYGLPVRRAGEDTSVYAFSDEIDAWLRRVKPDGVPYVRPTFIVADVVSAETLSNLKLAIEGAKFNVLTAYTYSEILATASKYDVDGFVIDSIILDINPGELGTQLRQLYPSKCRILVGDEGSDAYDLTVPQANPAAVVSWLIDRFGTPRLD